MRWSQYLLPTLKETPADAEVVSHQLMMRAGMIRKVAAGIYNYMPLGLRSIRKVEAIVREELDRAGASTKMERFPPLVRSRSLVQPPCRAVSGRSSAWLERCVRDAEVAGSNPVAPILEATPPK